MQRITLMLFFGLASVGAAPRPSPWNGEWLLDTARSSPAAKDGAAGGYRFRIEDDKILWEIPELGEVARGLLDGKPMAVNRNRGREAGLTLSVRAEGRGVLVYEVARNGKPLGDGRMTLVDHNQAWIDLTRDHGASFWSNQITYRKR